MPLPPLPGLDTELTLQIGGKKCSNCGTQLIFHFRTKVDPKTGEEVCVARCARCHDKHKENSHAKRNAEIAAKREAAAKTRAEEVAGRETKKCIGCRKVLVVEECFGLNKKGNPLARCNGCVVKHSATSLAYSKTAARKASVKRYLSGEAGRARKVRENSTRKMRRFFDKGFAMNETISTAASALLSGSHETSPTFIARTSFASEHEFLEHMKSTLPEGLVLEDVYGEPEDDDDRSVWDAWCDRFYQQEHRIPRENFDHSNPVDVKRCWSKANMLLRTARANTEKSYTLLDSEIEAVGAEHWPLAWNGVPPTEAQKLELYAKFNTKFEPTDAQRDEYITHLEAKNAAHKRTHKRIRRALSGPREEALDPLEQELSDHYNSEDEGVELDLESDDVSEEE